MKIAVEGCAHGELETIYDTLQYLEQKEGFKIDLLLCCGDFQASRNEADLRCMAVPPKYSNICSFYKYYTGLKTAPILTIFIGGNHEASNYLQELPYGGWVAPNIYYLGYAGVVNVAGLRIGGLSGIYKGQDYMKGHFEAPPYSDSSKRSVYHIRNLEVFRLKQLSQTLNVFLSHDWPSGVWEYGDKAQLIRFKPFFEDDINRGHLGSKPTQELLNFLKPDYFFSAHLHCKFAAVVPHECGKVTKFLALDKCLPKRRFLQVVDIPHDANLKTEICYDLEWLTILRLTNHLLSVKNVTNYLPGAHGNERWCFTPNEEEKSFTLNQFGDLVVPNNFEKTSEGYCGHKTKNFTQPEPVCNSQTVSFCNKLLIDDPLSLIINLSTNSVIDDSNVSKTPRKLVLPQPVNESESFEEFFSAEVTETEIEAPVEEQLNSSKTFKRRNASIYQK
ncbi:lariat debranching enzyme [Tribolium madens]|uniref:lariat debranching enzyme n=1 Tax=Tribolium madens TaxID=41895 RepID=UPI001CF72F9C|nr:lariat debranching enzyme [Tribolium madens]XP_044270848.1 lariat debranching enzyme [Tribolium madens]